ncbi:MAG TPA: hypothetical protein VKT49_08745 [Bryobacteraceae bacterium]|nr:hypothetical protein [Bryobacteraceae bacterium]
MKARCLILLAAAGCMQGQNGQQGPRPEWPCVAGRAVDPAFLETSESTGGQVFLFQKSEAAQTTVFLTADHTHPATIVRAVGSLSGAGEYEFPVDSTVSSLLITASVQCRKSIGVFRPSGTEMMAANSTRSVDLQASRAVIVDNPEPGKWKVRLEGTGVFVLAVRAQSPLRLGEINFLNENGGAAEPRLGAAQTAMAYVGGTINRARFDVLGPSGQLLGTSEGAQSASSAYRFAITPGAERFRIRIAGTDGAGWPVERTAPILFRARAQN